MDNDSTCPMRLSLSSKRIKHCTSQLKNQAVYHLYSCGKLIIEIMYYFLVQMKKKYK